MSIININSLTKNSLYSTIKSGAVLLFPLVTFSYASHILQADGLGKVDFAKSYTAYFTMLAMLGVVNYATREAAKCREDKQKLSQFAHEVLLLNSISMFISYVAFFTTIYFIPHLQAYKALLYINSITIILTVLGVDWLYSAVEDYRYISIRTCVVQALALVMTLVFVRSADDIYNYAIIQVLAASGANIVSFVHSRKYISYEIFGKYNLIQHVKPILRLFTVTVFVQVFTHMDATMLSFMGKDSDVGMYAAATKISNAVSGIFISMTVVISPRISYYTSKGKSEKVFDFTVSAINYILMLAFPSAIGIILLAPEIINIFSGKTYIDATTTTRVMALRVILVPLNTFIVTHLFIPIGKEKNNIFSTGIAAVTNLIINYILIPKWFFFGAAIATVIAELIELTINLFFLSTIYSLKHIFKKIYIYAAFSLSIIPLWFIESKLVNGIWLVIMLTLSSVIVYATLLYLTRNSYFTHILFKLPKLLSRKK